MQNPPNIQKVQYKVSKKLRENIIWNKKGGSEMGLGKNTAGATNTKGHLQGHTKLQQLLKIYFI